MATEKTFDLKLSGASIVAIVDALKLKRSSISRAAKAATNDAVRFALIKEGEDIDRLVNLVSSYSL